MKELPHEKPIFEYEKTLKVFEEQSDMHKVISKKELNDLRKKLQDVKNRVYGSLSSWERVLICRHPTRPHSFDYIQGLTDSFHELHGDRLFRDDPAVIGGIGMIEGVRVMIIGQEKGNDTQSRLNRNFGMVHPEGYRKALRLTRLAEKFDLPVVFLLDTPGAYPGLTAEERGQGWAIAENLKEFFGIQVPMIAVVIGEGCSGGALGMGIADRVAMLEHAYYSVISPEGCASILWKDPTKKEISAKALKLHAEDLLSFNMIEKIISEPQGGAHHNPKVVYENTKRYILDTIDELKKESKESLLNHRYEKFRKIGALTNHETPLESSCL